mmetsp:Transcript_9645/g.39505  ORF Transcript_9645/g.39505 Transcript_9645/m.39505 type:complete len:334 (-) Transcript_9645:1341-2342(-)
MAGPHRARTERTGSSERAARPGGTQRRDASGRFRGASRDEGGGVARGDRDARPRTRPKPVPRAAAQDARVRHVLRGQGPAGDQHPDRQLRGRARSVRDGRRRRGVGVGPEVRHLSHRLAGHRRRRERGRRLARTRLRRPVPRDGQAAPPERRVHPLPGQRERHQRHREQRGGAVPRAQAPERHGPRRPAPDAGSLRGLGGQTREVSQGGGGRELLQPAAGEARGVARRAAVRRAEEPVRGDVLPPRGSVPELRVQAGAGHRDVAAGRPSARAVDRLVLDQERSVRGGLVPRRFGQGVVLELLVPGVHHRGHTHGHVWRDDGASHGRRQVRGER